MKALFVTNTVMNVLKNNGAWLRFIFGKKTVMACMELQFTDNISGPVRALGLFAALGLLPDKFHLQKTPGANSWNVRISINSEDRTQIVLSKLETLPGLISISREAEQDHSMVSSALMEQNNV